MIRKLTGIIAISLLTTAVYAETFESRLGIEIQANQFSRKAKVRDTVKAQDGFLVYAMPAQDSFIYVIQTQKGKSSPLVKATALQKNLAFANAENATPIGATSDITIIISKTALQEMTAINRDGSMSAADWKIIEDKLVKRSSTTLDAATKPTPVAANMRAIGAEAFARTLPVYSGPGLIVARFHLDVQN